MKYVFYVIVGLVLLPVLSLSQSSDCPKPQRSLLDNLCFEIENRATDDDDASTYNYRFERTIDEMACVNRTTDPDSVIIKKVQNWWNKYKFDCHCNRANFVLANGNILKYAVQQRFDAFFVILKQYKLEYNFIDPKDGKTLLDFALGEYKSSLRAAPETQRTADYKKIYDYLRAEGALYRSELK